MASGRPGAWWEGTQERMREETGTEGRGKERGGRDTQEFKKVTETEKSHREEQTNRKRF